MCAGEDAHPDPKRRYWASVVGGVGYVIFGLLAGVVTAFVALAPPILIQAVAGLALIGAFSGSAVAAFQAPGSGKKVKRALRRFGAVVIKPAMTIRTATNFGDRAQISANARPCGGLSLLSLDLTRGCRVR